MVDRESLKQDIQRRPDQCWTLFLHLLGWQRDYRSPIRATRTIWAEHTEFGGTPEEFQAFIASKNVPAAMLGKLAELPIPPPFFASTLEQDVALASVYAIDLLACNALDLPIVNIAELRLSLESLKPGREDAQAYHDLIASTIGCIFTPELTDIRVESESDAGRSRVDFEMRNQAERGFLYDLPFRYHVKCPNVFFECKNESSDPGNQGFQQIVHRLTDDRGCLGFLVCRRLEDRETARERCRTEYNKSTKTKTVLILDDDDIVALAVARNAGGATGVSAYLTELHRQIVFDMPKRRES